MEDAMGQKRTSRGYDQRRRRGKRIMAFRGADTFHFSGIACLGERTHIAVIGVAALVAPVRGMLNRIRALGAPIPVVRQIAGLGAGPLHPASDRVHQDAWPCRYAEAVVLGV